jgi:hypothetical protein
MAASADRTGTSRAGKTWPELLGLAIGAIYLLIGIIGFFITGFDNFFGNEALPDVHHEDATLLGFMINPVHNVVHILIGAAGLALSRSLPGARSFGWLLAIGYGATFVYGLFAVNEEWDFLNLNVADNWLHGLSALVGLVIALGPVRDAIDSNRRV